MIHVLHGIHTGFGSPVVPGLLPYLTGTVAYPDYGWISALDTGRWNSAFAGMLKPYVKPSDVLIGHSNGCAVIYNLLEQGVAVAGVVFINGALKRNFVLPATTRFAHVYFNAGDDATLIAQGLADAPDPLIDPNWGDLGHVGYGGTDPRVTNFDCGNTPSMPKVDGHSEFFYPANLPAWGPFLNSKVENQWNPS